MRVTVTSNVQSRTYYARKVEVMDGELHMTTNNSYIVLNIDSWRDVEIVEEGDDEDGS